MRWCMLYFGALNNLFIRLSKAVDRLWEERARRYARFIIALNPPTAEELAGPT